MRLVGRIAALLALALAPTFLRAQVPALRPLFPHPVWPVADAPLSVWIRSPTPAANADSLTIAVLRALGEWNEQHLPVHLRPHPDSLTADVRVTWVDRFVDPISGRTTCVDDGAGHIVSANIVLALKHSDGRMLNDEETRVLALHELGHAIGLEHSADSASIMWPKVRVRSISAADRARVLSLYQR